MKLGKTIYRCLLPLACVCILYTGCLAFADFYLVNKSDKSITATVTVDGSLSRFGQQYTKDLELLYADTVFPPRKLSPDKLTQRLKFTAKNDSTLEVVIPPRSTVHIIADYLYPVQSITIKGDGINQSYSGDKITKAKQLRHYGFPAIKRRLVYTVR